MRYVSFALFAFGLIQGLFAQVVISTNYRGAGKTIDDAAIEFNVAVKVAYSDTGAQHTISGTIFKASGKNCFYLDIATMSGTRILEVGSCQYGDWTYKSINVNSNTLLNYIGQEVQWRILYTDMPTLKTGTFKVPKPASAQKSFSKTLRNGLNVGCMFEAWQNGQCIGRMWLEAGAEGAMDLHTTSDNPVDIYGTVPGMRMDENGNLVEGSDNGDPFPVDVYSPSMEKDGQNSKGGTAKSNDPNQNSKSSAAQGGPTYVSSVLNDAPKFTQTPSGAALNDRVFQDGISVLHKDFGEVVNALNKTSKGASSGSGGSGNVDFSSVNQRLDKLVSDSSKNTEAIKKETEGGFLSLFSAEKRISNAEAVAGYNDTANTKYEAERGRLDSIKEEHLKGATVSGDVGGGNIPAATVDVEIGSFKRSINFTDFEENTFGGYSLMRAMRPVILWAMAIYTATLLVRKIKDFVFAVGATSNHSTVVGIESLIPGIPQAKLWGSASIWVAGAVALLVGFIVAVGGGFGDIAGFSWSGSISMSSLSSLGPAISLIDGVFPVVSSIMFGVLILNADIIAAGAYLLIIALTKYTSV